MRPLGNCSAVSYDSAILQVPANFGGAFHLLTARLACVLVAVAGVFELGAAFKELEDQLIRFPAHHGGCEVEVLRLSVCE